MLCRQYTHFQTQQKPNAKKEGGAQGGGGEGEGENQSIDWFPL